MTWHMRLGVAIGGLIVSLWCCTMGAVAIENNDCCYSAAQLGMVGLIVCGLALTSKHNRAGRL